jgi:Purple acid Phosphatase, N-terminal domain/Calcineurin-like phosphoesterase
MTSLGDGVEGSARCIEPAGRGRCGWRRIFLIFASIVLALSNLCAFTGTAHAADIVDEIHYGYGNTPDAVVFDWRGAENTIYYGADSTYGSQAVASAPTVEPVDNPGPFEEVALTGLTPGSTYHYRIGAGGLDHTFSASPSGSFTWADTGDTATTLCDSWMAQTQSLIAAQSPNFVTHGGDISYANECGQPAVHQYYLDQEAWSHSAAFMPAWGNHEYGPPSSTAPAGTPRDSMLNYKGRSYIPNAQTVPIDTTTKTTNPGCGWETGSTTNTCLGEDWGYFQAGHVLYISYPEPWQNAYSAWEPVAQSLMSNAQADPGVDFIVTFGHRPAYSSLSSVTDSNLRAALTTLSGLYSPTSSNPSGKYILNIAHHVHGEEVFAPIGGLVNITDGGGGAAQTTYDSTPATGSIYRTVHPGILSAQYDAAAHTMAVKLLCGPAFAPNPKEPCTYGTTLYSQSFTSLNTPVTPPVLTTSLNDGLTTPGIGQSVTYTATVAAGQTGTTTQNVSVATTLPSNYSITNTGGGTASGNTVTWSLGNLGSGLQFSRQVTATLASGAAGTPLVASAQAQSTDSACSDIGSSCLATDTDSIASTTQWITNQSVETNLTGWTGVYNSNSQVSRVTTDAYDGIASIQVVGVAAGAAGVTAKPKPVSSTTAGLTYTGGVWVRGQVSGETILLLLIEVRSDGTTAGSKRVSLKVPDTAWHQLSVAYPAVQSGNQLGVSIYCSNLTAGGWFHADMMSLTSPN